jgi:hypothetical protein
MNRMKNHLYRALLVFSLASCSANNDVGIVHTQSHEVKKTNVTVIQELSDVYSLEATFSPEFGWGYQILNNGKLYINQPHIPSIQGNIGFDSKDNAIKTGEYIINKLENNIFPPTVSPEELDSLGVL